MSKIEHLLESLREKFLPFNTSDCLLLCVDMNKVTFRIVAMASGFLKTCIHKPTLVLVKLIEKAFSMMQNADLIAKAKTAMASSERNVDDQVCVSGRAGDIGQPMSMFMAMNPLVKIVSIHNVTMTTVPPNGVDADFSHL